MQLIFGTLVADGDDVCLSYSFVADKLTKDELLLSLDLFWMEPTRGTPC
ncbi:MAG: hypothetical protein R2755_23685 [Acidimicrobiales bacterium]